MKCFGLEMNLDIPYDFLVECLPIHNGDIPEEDYNTFWLVLGNIKAEIISDVKNEENLYVLLYVLYCMNPFYVYTAIRILLEDKIFIRAAVYPFYDSMVKEMIDMGKRFRQVLCSQPVGNYTEL